MSELAAKLAEQKRRVGNGNKTNSTSSGEAKACDHYELDLTGASFGICKCGFPKAAHVQHSRTMESKPKNPPKFPHRSMEEPRQTHQFRPPDVAETEPRAVPKLPSRKQESHAQIKSEMSSYKAIYNFSSSRVGDLTLKEGDIITDVQKHKPGWLKGTVSRRGEQISGLFPDDYVKEYAADNVHSSNIAPQNMSTKEQTSPLPAKHEPFQQETSFEVKDKAESVSHEQPASRHRSHVDELKAKLGKDIKPPVPVPRQQERSEMKAAAGLSKPEEPGNDIYQKPQKESLHSIKAPSSSFGEKEVESKPKRKQFKAQFNFQTNEPGDLPFMKGDVMDLVNEIDENWMECEDTKGNVGIVPCDYVVEIKNDTKSEKENAERIKKGDYYVAPNLPQKTAKIDSRRIAIALYDFEPQQPEDIKLTKGDYVRIKEEIDENWWDGVVLDVTGMDSANAGVFPLTFVRMLTEEELEELQNKPRPETTFHAPPVPNRTPKGSKGKVDNSSVQTTIPRKESTSASKHNMQQEAHKKGELQSNGFYRLKLTREYTPSASKPPLGEWYSDGDTYSCQSSIQSIGLNTTKTERFHIFKSDRSEVMLMIVQDSGSNTADLEYKLIPFEPLPEEVLLASSKFYGNKIIEYAYSKLGQRDGNGECWTLGDNALKYAGTQEALGLNFGQEVKLSEVLPGDVLQFKSCLFKFPGGSKSAGSPDHTAIVVKRTGGKEFAVIEQNPHPVGEGSYNFEHLVSGEYKAYRPLPKKENLNLVMDAYKMNAPPIDTGIKDQSTPPKPPIRQKQDLDEPPPRPARQHQKPTAPPPPSRKHPTPTAPPPPPSIEHEQKAIPPPLPSAVGPSSHSTAPPPPPRRSLEKKVALYNFDAQEDGDLSLKKGDIVVITKEFGEWSFGYIEGTVEQGQFPSSFVGDL